MALGRVGRGLMAPVLAMNLVVHIIVVGLAGWSLDKYINGQQNHHRNTSSSFMLIFALLAGAFGACSVIQGMMHLRAWQHESYAAAANLAVISWAMIALAFGFVCKEVILGGHRGKRLQTLELLIAISLLSQLMLSELIATLFSCISSACLTEHPPNSKQPKNIKVALE